ncbi:MAG: molybdenum cofactor biosynthesis protein [Actinobacteria bacterium HGW-Actinobacteria-4]|nr:MAG: molybdenum cofactor biosynthesis protein [Actinobacteria bacterium HGW-Actinobacteria-4]
MEASLAGTSAAVITVSDRCASGEREDRTGPVIARTLTNAGAQVTHATIPDGADSVESAVRGALAAGARLVLTTGGTGVSPRDFTPEATARVVTQLLPGITEALRRADADAVPAAMLSRGLAGIVGHEHRAVVINLPGSVAAVSSGMRVLMTVLPHLMSQLDGGDHP